MKYSRQREAILNVVQSNPIHPTADTVYTLVRQSEPNISLATVYRNLNLLTEQGLLIKIQSPQEPDRFDARLDCHHHFLCTHCHQLFDLEKEYATIQIQIAQPQIGFQITGYQLFLSGICECCTHKIKQKEVNKNE